ncbi:hypothetical protein BC830DRAFT_1234475 [Chytriomyces sp. MP71]|nr:hypothetical protein BC830DRAFT_1234475 [Chytriomyces sp. MP71]
MQLRMMMNHLLALAAAFAMTIVARSIVQDSNAEEGSEELVYTLVQDIEDNETVIGAHSGFVIITCQRKPSSLPIRPTMPNPIEVISERLGSSQDSVIRQDAQQQQLYMKLSA